MDIRSYLRPSVVLPRLFPSGFIRFTPTIAAYILAQHNLRNRNLNSPRAKRAIARYVEAIIANKFYTTHQGIAFDTAGRLRDGAHRLSAIIEAGKLFPQISVVLFVCFEQNPDAMFAVDCGNTRTNIDNWTIAYDVSKNKRFASVLSVTTFGRLAFSYPSMSPEQSAFAYEHFHRVVDEALEMFTTSSGDKVNNSSVVGVFARALVTYPAHRLSPFVSSLRRLGNDTSVVIASSLRERILKVRNSNTKDGKEDIYGMTQYCLDAFLNRPALTRATSTDDELFPVPDPFSDMRGNTPLSCDAPTPPNPPKEEAGF